MNNNNNNGTNITNISRLLFGTSEEREALQRINQESKYRDVLDQLLGIQPHITEHDFKHLTNNLLSVLKAVHDQKRVNPNSMQRITTKTFTQHQDGVTMVRTEERCYTTTVNEFLTEVEGIVSRIPVNLEKERLSDFQAMLDPFLRGLNKGELHNSQTAIYDSGMTMEKHPKFRECLDSFVSSLPSNSEHHIHDIIVHSYMCEFVTSFAVDNRVAIAVGVSLFVEIYPLMKQTGGLKYFLFSARDQVYFSKPFVSHIQTFASDHKYPLAIGAGSVIGLIMFPELKTVVPSLFYSIPPSALELHLPSNEFARNLYLNVATGLKDAVFLALDLYGDLRREIMYKLVGENIEEGVAFIKRLLSGIIK